MPITNDELKAKLYKICGSECVSVDDENIGFAGIAATGKKNSPDRKECNFSFAIPTESLMLLAEKAPDFLAVAVRQMITDSRNQARQTLEGKGMPKYTAKVIRSLNATSAFGGEAEEMVKALGFTMEQYNEAS